MTVDELRQALASLPGDLALCIAYPDLKNEDLAYETRDVWIAGLQEGGAGEGSPCFVIEAYGGV